jgi:HSP20 family protein
MALMRRPERSPFRSPFDLLFEDPWADSGRLFGGQMVPAMDMRETDDEYVVELEMPGVKPEDTEVTLEGRTLVIRGRFGEEREDRGGKERYMVRERRTGSFTRAVTLPGAVDSERVSSSFENGELSIVLPKAEEQKARRIPVGGGAAGAKRVGEGEGSTMS